MNLNIAQVPVLSRNSATTDTGTAPNQASTENPLGYQAAVRLFQPQQRPNTPNMPAGAASFTLDDGRTIYYNPRGVMRELSDRAGAERQTSTPNCVARLWQRLVATGNSTYQGREVMTADPIDGDPYNDTSEGTGDLLQNGWQAFGSGPRTIVTASNGAQYSVPTVTRQELDNAPNGATLASSSHSTLPNAFNSRHPSSGTDMATVFRNQRNDGRANVMNFARMSGSASNGPVYQEGTTANVLLIPKSDIIAITDVNSQQFANRGLMDRDWGAPAEAIASAPAQLPDAPSAGAATPATAAATASAAHSKPGTAPRTSGFNASLALKRGQELHASRRNSAPPPDVALDKPVAPILTTDGTRELSE